MQRIIKVGSMEVQKGLCTMGFRLGSDIGSEIGTTKVTHNYVYKLLDSPYTKKVVYNEQSNRATFTHGEIAFTLYEIK